MDYLALGAVLLLGWAGLHLYRILVFKSFPALIRKDYEGRPVANGAGSLLWDVSFLFMLYLYFFKGLSLSLFVCGSASNFIFACLGWFDDASELRPFTKLASQATAGLLCLALYVFGAGLTGSSFLFFPLCLLFLVWLVNAVNFMDILDGLCALIVLLLFAGFAGFFYLHHSSFFLYPLFWIVLLLAFLARNIYRPSVFLGDSGAHLLGSALFLCVLMAFNTVPEGDFSIFGFLGVLFSFLFFDFVYVCLKRFRKDQSVFLKSPDHLTFDLLVHTRSRYGTLLILTVFQGVATLLAIWVI